MSIVLEVSIVIIVATLLIMGALLLSKYIKSKFPITDYISFKESFELTDIPVVTFRQGKKKLNFILDTGSDECHINLPLVSVLEHKLTNYGKNVTGLEGNKIPCNIINMDISYGGHSFNSDFLVTDLTKVFEGIKKETGVQLHGILGCSFFNRYKYILDFDKMIFYTKK